MKSKKVTKAKPKQKRTKKIKQKQIVKQNVKVNVQSSGGSGSGGSSIPTVPQYAQPQYIPSVPSYFQDRRGEDVILQKLSEVVDKFNSKPEPVEELPKVNPQPVNYIDGVEDAETQSMVPYNNKALVSSKFASAPPANQNVLNSSSPLRLPSTEFNPSVYIGSRNLFSEEPEKIAKVKSKKQNDGPKISVPHDYQASARKGWETRRQKAEEAKLAEEAKKKADVEAFWADDEETPNEAMASIYFDDKALKKATQRLKYYADNLNSDITYQGLKRDYEEDKKKSAENFKSPVKQAVAKLESNISKASPVSKNTRSKTSNK